MSLDAILIGVLSYLRIVGENEDASCSVMLPKLRYRPEIAILVGPCSFGKIRFASRVQAVHEYNASEVSHKIQSLFVLLTQPDVPVVPLPL